MKPKYPTLQIECVSDEDLNIRVLWPAAEASEEMVFVRRLVAMTHLLCTGGLTLHVQRAMAQPTSAEDVSMAVVATQVFANTLARADAPAKFVPADDRPLVKPLEALCGSSMFRKDL